MTTFEALQAQHEALLLRQDAEDNILADAQAYIEQVRKEGSQITAPEARNQLRANLRYWAGLVYERTGDYPNTELLPSIPLLYPDDHLSKVLAPSLNKWWILGSIGVVLILLILYLSIVSLSNTVFPTSTPTVTPTSTPTVTPTSTPIGTPSPTTTMTPRPTPTMALPSTPTVTPTSFPMPISVSLLESGRLQSVATHQGHEGPVLQIAFSPSGSYLASGGGSGVGMVWSRSLLNLLISANAEGWIQTIAFSPDEDFFATGGNDSFVRLFSLSDGSLVASRQQSAFVFATIFNPLDNKTLIIGQGDGTISLWDWTTGVMLGERKLSNNAIYDLSFSSDGKTIAAANLKGGLFVIDASTNSLPLRCRGLGTPASVLSVAYSPVADLIVLGNDRGEVVLVDPLSCAIQSQLMGHTDNVNAVTFSPDGQLLASGSRDRSIIVWDVLQETQIVQLRQNSSVETVAFDPRGFLIASGEEDGEITLWGIAP